MTAQVNPDAQAASVNANTAPTAPPTSSWGQVSGGPAALAFPAILKLMDLLTQLMDLYNRQAQSQVDTEIASAQSAANATRNAAQNRAFATACQAASSFASMGLSFGGMLMQNSATKDLNTAKNTFSDQSTRLSALDTPLTTRLAGGPAARQIGPGGAALPRDPAIETAISQGRNGIFTKESLEDGSHARAVAHMDDVELGEYSRRLSQEKTQVSDAILAKGNEITNVGQMYTAGKEILNGLSDTITTSVGAHYNTKEGEENATASLAGTNTQIAKDMLGNSQALLGKAYDEAMQALATLQTLAQAGRSPV